MNDPKLNDKMWGAIRKCIQEPNALAEVEDALKAGANPTAERSAGSLILLVVHSLFFVTEFPPYAPLGFAVWNGLYDLASILIRYGVDLGDYDWLGRNAFHFIYREECSIQIVDLLLANGADVNITEVMDTKEKNGNRGTGSPLHRVCAASNPSAVDKAKLLISHSADVEASGYKGWRCLHHAAVQGNIQLVSLLLQHGAKTGSRTLSTGETPAQLALSQRSSKPDAQKKDIDKVVELLEKHEKG
jgi:ankyrin repeat protein